MSSNRLKKSVDIIKNRGILSRDEKNIKISAKTEVNDGSFDGTEVESPVKIIAVKDDVTKGVTSFYFELDGERYWIAQVENPE